MNRRIATILLPVLLLACGQATPLTPTATPLPPTGTPLPASPSPFTVAIEYGILGVAQAYAGTGVTAAKLQLVFSVWGNIEPEPGQYVWGPLDAAVQEYQAQGFTSLQVLLSAESPWAATRQPRLGDLGDTFPQEAYLDDYEAFVRRVVERYDGDGLDDMPGLLYPIHQYGVEREFTGFWPGTAEEYNRLLRLAYPAIKAADPQAQVLLVALLMADVFDGKPDQEEISRRLAQTPSFRKGVAAIQAILASCDAYDMVDFHSLGDYSEIPPTAAWIRQQLAANGCDQRPIWIGDAFPLSGMVGFGGFVPPTPFFPVTVETREAVVALLRAVADPADTAHQEATAWLEAEIARSLVKKIVVAAGEGLAGINIGNLEDWKTGLPAVDKASVPGLGASLFMGLMDTAVTQQRPGGKLPFSGHTWSQARRPGEPRPGYYALQMVTAGIHPFLSVARLELGTGVWAYRFDTPEGPLWVLWYEDGQLHLPGQPLATTSVTLEWPATQALASRAPTARGQTAGEIEAVAATGGVVTLELDATPLFVRAGPE